MRWLLARSLPALLIGVLSGATLWGLDELAELLQGALWEALPHAIGVDPSSGWWIFAVLALTGVAVGLVLQFAPGHGGFDSATHELDAPVLPLRTLPGLALVTVLALAGGVSLGPESPIIAINTGIVVLLVTRFLPFYSAPLAALTTASATIGAMFGTPVAAALLLTGVLAALPARGALWDRLFLPLVAAGAGAVTMLLLGGPMVGMALPKAESLGLPELGAAAAIAVAAAAIGVLGALAFPWVHRAFHALRYPLLIASAGGVVLGALGALGGPVTLFKGLHETGELLTRAGEFGLGGLALVLAVKLAALLVSASAGFRGGRIFPALFLGVATGLLAQALVPQIPLGVAVASGVLGMVLAVGRDGWLALMLAALVAGDVALLPILALAVLPAWLVVTAAPHFLVRPRAPEAGAEPAAPERAGASA
ncbi:MAG: ion channel protein [Actinomycetales bacterium]|nr:ion channel protein [Actinomycetales bacterium]